MFCIAAFIVFGILAVFSASYRPLAAQAWHCVLRRVQFKPCDIDFSEEVKGRLIGKLIVRRPRLARFLSRWIDWLSFAFVILSIWSVVYLFNAGLNLWVYDTCSPKNVESCSLSGEACGVDQSSIGFFDALQEGKLGTWAANPFVRFIETVSRVPDRLKHWEPKAYFGPTATTYYPADPGKPFALEVLDPSCKFCRQLFRNIKETGFETTHNLSYLLYPIPKAGSGGYKFPYSARIASYVEATKRVPLKNNPSGVAPDWQLLEHIFGQKSESIDWQSYFNMGATEADTDAALRGFLLDIGYSQRQADEIAALSRSADVQDALRAQKEIVEAKLHTIKIPTILFGGRRYDRAVGTEVLSAHDSLYETSLAFDAQQWTAAENDPQSTTRHRMIEDLLVKHPLIGMTKEQVTELLGPIQSDAKFADATHVSYWLAPDLIDSEWLVLEFNDGRVVRHEVIAD